MTNKWLLITKHSFISRTVLSLSSQTASWRFWAVFFLTYFFGTFQKNGAIWTLKGEKHFCVFQSFSISSEFVLGKFCQQIWRCHYVPVKGWDIKAYVMHTSWSAEQCIHVFGQSRRLKWAFLITICPLSVVVIVVVIVVVVVNFLHFLRTEQYYFEFVYFFE